jgi:hypothetical protein
MLVSQCLEKLKFEAIMPRVKRKMTSKVWGYLQETLSPISIMGTRQQPRLAAVDVGGLFAFNY